MAVSKLAGGNAAPVRGFSRLLAAGDPGGELFEQAGNAEELACRRIGASGRLSAAPRPSPGRLALDPRHAILPTHVPAPPTPGLPSRFLRREVSGIAEIEP